MPEKEKKFDSFMGDLASHGQQFITINNSGQIIYFNSNDNDNDNSQFT